MDLVHRIIQRVEFCTSLSTFLKFLLKLAEMWPKVRSLLPCGHQLLHLVAEGQHFRSEGIGDEVGLENEGHWPSDGDERGGDF